MGPGRDRCRAEAPVGASLRRGCTRVNERPRRRAPSRARALLLIVAAGTAAAYARPSVAAVRSLAQVEEAYADFNDAYGAIALIDSDPGRFPGLVYEGKSRAEWQKLYAGRRSQLLRELAPGRVHPATPQDARAVQVMRAALAESSATAQTLAPSGRCRDRQRARRLEPLQAALYACFAELANNLQFEGASVTRVDAFELLGRMEDPRRREALFLAFQPVWRVLNESNQSASPYRRMIRLAAGQSRAHGSPIEAAARTVGISPQEAQRWLERILDTWRAVSPQEEVEPWDYRFQGGGAARELDVALPREALLPLNESYYRDLGLDLQKAQVLYDLEPRSGKAPLAYTDYIRRGRTREGHWEPTLVRVLANYGHGGLGSLNELVHEDGHAAHMLALHTRPAFMDLGDAIFYEAVADVPSWSVYEPAWQARYLGRSVSESAALRALFSNVMLDVAWALFDLRMLRDPGTDPNALWTEITHRYLHVTPHPELPWWAVRVQLVDAPGYMVNYGLGAVITADIRQRITQQLGPFQAGEPRWFGWLSGQLLASGEEDESAAALVRFLGRPVSPEALIGELHRMSVPGAHP